MESYIFRGIMVKHVTDKCFFFISQLCPFTLNNVNNKYGWMSPFSLTMMFCHVQTAFMLYKGRTKIKTICQWVKNKQLWNWEKRENQSEPLPNHCSMPCTIIWNVLKKNNTSGVLNIKHQSGRVRKASGPDNRNIGVLRTKPNTAVGDLSSNL